MLVLYMHRILTKSEEKLLVHTTILLQKWPYRIIPKTVIDLGMSYIIDLGKTIYPAPTLRDWFSGFMKR